MTLICSAVIGQHRDLNVGLQQWNVFMLFHPHLLYHCHCGAGRFEPENVPISLENHTSCSRRVQHTRLFLCIYIFYKFNFINFWKWKKLQALYLDWITQPWSCFLLWERRGDLKCLVWYNWGTEKEKEKKKVINYIFLQLLFHCQIEPGSVTLIIPGGLKRMNQM